VLLLLVLLLLLLLLLPLPPSLPLPHSPRLWFIYCSDGHLPNVRPMLSIGGEQQADKRRIGWKKQKKKHIHNDNDDYDRFLITIITSSIREQ
jgi:hypothetical protein